jgi:hypothetical protein
MMHKVSSYVSVEPDEMIKLLNTIGEGKRTPLAI